jgi:hypothetical protein
MRYAAVDIGSNSLRMLAAEISPGHPPRQLAEERIVTRLGEGVFRDGAISARSFDELIVALTRMAETYRGLDVAGVRAVATSAVRDASNQAEFLERAAAALGSLAREFQEPGMAAHVAQANGVTLLMLRAAGVRGIDLDTFKEELVLSENRKRTK